MRRSLLIIGVLCVIVGGAVTVGRQLRSHPTSLHLSVYCQGALYLQPTVVQPITTIGRDSPCQLAPDSVPVVITLYQQRCVIGPDTIPVMRATRFTCAIPGASAFTASDDYAFYDATVGRCLTDFAFIRTNAPCRLYITDMDWT